MATLKVMVASRYLQRDLVVVLVDSAVGNVQSHGINNIPLSCSAGFAACLLMTLLGIW